MAVILFIYFEENKIKIGIQFQRVECGRGTYVSIKTFWWMFIVPRLINTCVLLLPLLGCPFFFFFSLGNLGWLSFLQVSISVNYTKNVHDLIGCFLMNLLAFAYSSHGNVSSHPHTHIPLPPIQKYKTAHFLLHFF